MTNWLAAVVVAWAAQPKRAEDDLTSECGGWWRSF